MCDVCGCGDPHKVTIDVHTSLLAKNDRDAAHLRAHFAEDGVLALNVMGSPGSGKTALIEAVARSSTPKLKLAAVSGDLATSLDADRLSSAGVPSASITTGSACHLDAAMVHHALHDDALARAVHESDVFFVENVGNLVCPAIYDLGQAKNVVVLSITEGVDKPLKYPVMFRVADLVVLSKVDLVPYLPGTSIAALRENIARVAPSAEVIACSAVSGEGLGDLLAWLESQRRAVPPRSSAPGHTHPRTSA
jgi:hydrogenase nickel incorporation protein HypB